MVEGIKEWTAAEIAALTQGVLYGNSDWTAQSVSIDTRTITPGELFIAIRGERFAGEDFLDAAKSRGAVAAIVQSRRNIEIAQIVVADTRAALRSLAQARRRRSRAKFIGLTGSNGKTSTKEMLYHIFSQQGPTLATVGNLNNDIGVPLTLLQLRDFHQFAIIEMGANHIGEIAQSTEIVDPDVAVVTNVSAAHLSGFGDLLGVVAAKDELYAYSRGAIVINADLEWSDGWCAKYANRTQKTFALHNNADVVAKNIAPDGRYFDIVIDDQKVFINWQIYGQHNVANALAACAAAAALGVSLEKVANGLNGLQATQARLSAFSVGGNIVFDDTYNANPASFKAGIDVIAKAPYSVVIAGEMAELGAESTALHQEIVAYAEANHVNEFWALNAPAYGSSARVKHWSSLDTVAQALQKLLRQKNNCAILIKGSRSAHMERIFSAAKLERQRGEVQ